MPSRLPELCPSDHLLYNDGSLVDRVICLKTWADVAHIEVYAGNGRSMASRNGIGVDEYPLRIMGLKYVLRPRQVPNFTGAAIWFTKVRGQAYDFMGLLCFALAVKQGSPNKQFCSEFATNWCRAASLRPFSENWPADKVAPVQFLQSPSYDCVWRAG